MPTPTFDFYQRAYAINQAWGDTTKISLSSIKMGGTGNLAYQVTKTFYADAASNSPNYNMIAGPNYYNNNFQYNSAGHTHSASYLQFTNVGKPVPVADSFFQQPWDQTSRPSALGDFYSSNLFGDLRDGSWVETGSDPNMSGQNIINVYNINGSSGHIDWISTIITGCPFTADCANTRLFTHPTFNSNSVPGYSYPSSLSLIAYFAWDGSGQLYYELFGFDYTGNSLYSLTNLNLPFYDEFQYQGKHDIFFLPNSMNGCLLIWGPNAGGHPQIYEIDLNGSIINNADADAVSYSYALDVICWGDNHSSLIWTAVSSSTNQINSTLASHCNLFDCDCNDYIEGINGPHNDTFYFGDDQTTHGYIYGWAISVDGGGNIIGAISERNSLSGLSLPVLKRVVAIAPFSMVIGGDGIHTTTQVLARISCKNSWYTAVRSGSTNCYAYPTTSHHTDFLAMDHSYCRDIYGGYDSTGFYTSGRETGLPVGAGNQHIFSIDSGLNNYFFSNNYVSQYQNQNQTAVSYSSIQNNLIYLGPANWTNSSGLSYVYLSITSGGAAYPFSTPAGASPGVGTGVSFVASFTANAGVLLLTFFYG